MLRILVANSKGGCGKTLIATNLAAAYAHRGHHTVLMDCDPQGSSQRWMTLRSVGSEHLLVQPLNPGDRRMEQLWSLRIPARTRVLVVDAPAGLDGGQLAELVRRCDHLLIPVLPSQLDLAATGDFLDKLSRLPDVRSGRLRIGMVGNRLKANTLSARDLRAELDQGRYPLVACLGDAQLFAQAAAIGRGLAEFDQPRCRRLAAGIHALMDWLPPPPPAVQPVRSSVPIRAAHPAQHKLG